MAKKLRSINPANNQVVKEYNQHSIEEIELIIKKSVTIQIEWKKKNISK